MQAKKQRSERKVKHGAQVVGRSLDHVVRLFIVQERYNGGEWLDDPDQPDDRTHGFDQAKWWLENDNKMCRGHETTYEHRIVERTETQVWPNAHLSGGTLSAQSDCSQEAGNA